MIYLFDRKEQLLPDGILPRKSALSSLQTQKLGGLITHQIEVEYRDALDDCAYFGMRDPQNDSLFWMYKVTARRKSDHTAVLDGIYKLFDDLRFRGYVKDIRPQDKPPSVPLLEILKDTGWRIGSDTTTRTATSNFYYVSKLAAFWQVLETWGIEFRPRMTFSGGRIVEQWIDLADRFAEDTGRIYTHGDRLLTVQAESAEETLATAFIGRGKGEEKIGDSGEATGGFGRKITFEAVEWRTANGDPVNKPLGQEYVELPDKTARYGFADDRPRFDIFDFPDEESPAELLRKTYEAALVASRPKVQYRATVTDERQVPLGGLVRIKRKDLGIAYQTRIFQIERSFLLPKIQKMDFGDHIVFSRTDSQIMQEKAEKKKEAVFTSYIDKMAAVFFDHFQNEDGYNYDLKAGNSYGLPAGYYSFDRPISDNPTKVIGMSAGKLIISNSKTSEGQWIPSVFGTGDGFNASHITAGTIHGGSAFWNLETAEFNLGNGQLYYSPATGLTLSEQIKDELKGKSIERIVSEYALSTDENAPSSGWAEERPTGEGALWRRYKFVYTDHTSATTEPEKDSGAAIEKGKETAIQTALSIVQGELTAAQEAAAIYADGVVTESEARQKKDVETRIAELQAILMSDSETRMQEAIDYIDTQMADLQGYIWASGNVIHIGQKGSAMAVQITNKEIRMLVNGVVMSTWDNSAMRVDKLVTKELVVADADGIEKFQFVHRQPNGVDHLTLMYIGG